MVSAPRVPNSVATVAMRDAGVQAGMFGAAMPAGGTGLPPPAAAGADEPADEPEPEPEPAGGAGAGVAATPLTVSQSLETRSLASEVTLSLPAPQMTRSELAPFATIVSSPA